MRFAKPNKFRETQNVNRISSEKPNTFRKTDEEQLIIRSAKPKTYND